jgi:hypothetical protein
MIMKRVYLHLRMFAMLAPAGCALLHDCLFIQILGIIYLSWLFFYLVASDNGRRFLHAYYHEILRMENDLL